MGSIIAILTQVLSALAAYLQLRNKSVYYNTQRLSRAKQKELINEIEKLRSIGTNDSNDRADLLRSELIDEQRFADDLSAYYSKTKGE